MKRGMILLWIVVLLTLPAATVAAAAGAEGMTPVPQSEAEEIPVIIDVLILRPAGLVACVVGLAAAVIALPFAIPSGSMDKVSRALIQEPFVYTFKRPLGKNMPGN